jgi:hypothetical protein
MKKIISTFFLTFMVLALVQITPASIQNEAEAGDCGSWTMADRYGRYECAGPARDCYSLCPIIIIAKL